MTEDAFSLVSPEFKEAGPTGSYGWDLYWTDNLPHATEDMPAVHTDHFVSKPDADARKAEVLAQFEVVACVVPTLAPTVKPKQAPGRRRHTHFTA